MTKKEFSSFYTKKVARFNEAKIAKLMLDPGIIRNHSKINSAITNAKVLIDLQKNHAIFSYYFPFFVGYKPIKNRWKRQEDAPTRTELSDQLSKDLKNEDSSL